VNRLTTKPTIQDPQAGDVVFVDGPAGVRGFDASRIVRGSGELGTLQVSNPTDGHLLVFSAESAAWVNDHKSLITDGGNF
jgi:hypothetical protein